MGTEKLSMLVKKFREREGLTVMQLAKKAGLGNGTIGDIERGKSRGSTSSIKKIADALGLTAEEKARLDFAYLGKAIPNVSKIEDTLIYIPVKAVASAGNGCLNFGEDIKRIVVRKNGFDENCYLIEVNGDSMEPLIQDGAYIIVDPREIEIQDNKIYVVELDGQTYIKKIIRNEQLKIIILKSINQEYEDIFVTEDMANNFFVKGRAIKYILEGRL